MAADLADVADELYGLLPEEFVVARTDAQRRARAHGDRELVKQIGALGKPSVAAWVVNALVRDAPDEVGQLIELGGLLREAQRSLAGPQLRALGQQRQQLLGAMTRQGQALARRLGRPVTSGVATQVEETLRAAVVDPAAGEAVLSGRLTSGLTYSGLGEVDVSGAVALARRPAPGPASAPAPKATPKATSTGAPARRAAAERAEAAKEQARQRERDARQRELRESRQELEDATAAADEATAELASAGSRVDELGTEHDARQQQAAELRDRLAELTEQLDQAEAHAREVAEELDRETGRRVAAEGSVATAERRRERAQARMDALRPAAAD